MESELNPLPLQAQQFEYDLRYSKVCCTSLNENGFFQMFHQFLHKSQRQISEIPSLRHLSYVNELY